MKDSTDAKEKTSRRGFTKTIATALVAVPVISSLSSCAKKPETPPAMPSPQPSPPRESGANPPVIIDGGSLQIMIPAKLKEGKDEPITPPRKYDKKYSPDPPNALGAIKGIHIIDDYAYSLLPEYTLLNNDTLQVQIWIAKVTKDEDNPTQNGEVVYEDISQHNDPDIVIQGGLVEVRLDKKLDDDNNRKLYKRKKKNQKRYHIHDWMGGHSPFRVAKLKVIVSSKPNDPIYTAEEDPATHINPLDNGVRIILIF
jgi:hypothetical protein